MCWCNPLVRTLCCGRPSCSPPKAAAENTAPRVPHTFTEAQPAPLPSLSSVWVAPQPAGAPLPDVRRLPPVAGFQRPPMRFGQGNDLEALGSVVGLQPGEATRLAAEVKANLALLEHCRNHDFSVPVDAAGSRIRMRWRCTNCGGVVDAQAREWYRRGRAHGHAHGAT